MPPARASNQKPSSVSLERAQETFLRPHHIPLLGLIFWTTHHDNEKRLQLSLDYALHVFRVVLIEVTEVATPKSFGQLIQELDKGKGIHETDHGLTVRTIRQLPTQLVTPHRLSEFFLDLTTLWNIAYEDEEVHDLDSALDKRSPFGLFCRRAYLAFRKMSFLAICTFVEDFQAWVAGDLTRGYDRVERSKIRHDDFLVKTQHDKQPRADPESYAEFERAKANGDKQAAGESLRRFFEQRFSEASDSDLRQHATLHHVRMHIATGHATAARKLIQEAITVARTSGDAAVLQQCMALLRRIEGKTSSHKEPLNELQAELPALEVLNDVGKLVREGQPLSDCFEKAVQALGIYDLPKSSLRIPTSEHEQWAFHAMQAVLWRLVGCEQLARLEESLVMTFTESGGSDDNRFTMIRNRAEAVSRQGREAEAFGILLDPETWRGLDQSLNQLAYWSGVIWITMLHFASRRGQHRQAHEFLKPRRPGSFINWKDFYVLDLNKANTHPDIESQLYRALQTRKVNQSTTSIDHLLKALWHSEYQGRFHLYRLGMILLADAGLELGMTVWSKRLIEEVMPQIISGDDLELRAFACFVLARCVIACCGEDASDLSDALPFLKKAEEDYRSLNMLPAVQDVLYIKAVVYNSLGDMRGRDKAAKEHMSVGREQRDLESIDVNDDWADIWYLISEACVILSSRH